MELDSNPPSTPEIALRLALAEKLYTLENERIDLEKKLSKYQIWYAVIFLVIIFLSLPMVADFLSVRPKASPFWIYLFAEGAILIAWAVLHSSNTTKFKNIYNQTAKKTFFDALCSLYGDNFSYRPVNQQIKDKLDALLTSVGTRLRVGYIREVYYDDNFHELFQEWEMLFGDLNVKYDHGKSMLEKSYNYYLLIPREQQRIDPKKLEAYGNELPENTHVLYNEKENVLAVFAENKEGMNYDFSLHQSLRDNKTLEAIQSNLDKNRSAFQELIALFEKN
jgi:hypothetical protein